MYKLYPMIAAAVQDIKILGNGPNAQISGYGDARSIESLAAWDKWVVVR